MAENAIHVHMKALQEASRPEFGSAVNKKDEAPGRSFDLRQALHAFL
jgi:hypothetical protein